MSMNGGRYPQSLEDVGQTVASFPTYEAAQKAVSTLIAADVPARDIAIVGQGLRSVERVTGRLGYATAARSGAINGVLLGLLFSAILVIGSPSVPIQAFVGVIFVGIAIGMLLSIITYSFVASAPRLRLGDAGHRRALRSERRRRRASSARARCSVAPEPSRERARGGRAAGAPRTGSRCRTAALRRARRARPAEPDRLRRSATRRPASRRHAARMRRRTPASEGDASEQPKP